MTPKQKKKKATKKTGVSLIQTKPGGAPAHGELANNFVHIFVDDQNLFWGIVNDEKAITYRIDFGKLMLAACRDTNGKARGVKTAYIAGIIPDDDSFWEVAKKKGWEVKRGYLGHSNRSKQDDAYLITEITATLYEKDGPSTVVVVAGDADYVPPLEKALKKGWRAEIAFIGRGISNALVPVAHEFRKINPAEIEYYTDWHDEGWL
jgi:uncharacterized LabA/DUF88 family protein